MPKGTVKALMKQGMFLKVIIGSIIVGVIAITGFLGMDYAKSIFEKPFVLKEEEDSEHYFTRVFPPLFSIEELSLYNTGWRIENQLYQDGEFIGQHKLTSLYWANVGKQVVICLCPSQEYDPEKFDTTHCIATRVGKNKTVLANEILGDYIQELNAEGIQITRNDFAPTMLYITDQEDRQIRKYIFYVAGVVVSGILLIWLKQLIAFANLKWYKEIRAACHRYGNLEDLFEQIEKNPWIYSNKGCYFNKEWLIDTKNKRIIKLEDVAWFYLRHHEGILRESIRASFYFKEEHKYIFKFSDEGDAAFFIEEMKKIVTWCETYYSKEKLKKWKENKQTNYYCDNAR